MITMRLIPVSFLRTSIRILLLQSFLAWLWLHLDKLPMSATTNLAIGTTIGTVINILKNTLDDSLGFITPWDTPYFLPMLLDEYILTTMPDLAVLLGESPCSKRIAGTNHETGICEPELAYACLQHAIEFETGRLSLEFLRACYEDYGVSPLRARKHHDRCHARSEHSDALSIRACTRAKEQIERNKEICFYVPPVFDCVLQYSTLEGFGRIPGHEHLMKGVCDRRVRGDMYIEGRFRNFRPIVKVDLA